MTDAIQFDRSMDFAYGMAAEVAPGVRRLVARNPGPLTFKGTNTYLVGTREVAVIDPGPDDLVHRSAILAAAGPGRITHIFLTHTHRDHSAGMAGLKAATGAITCGFGGLDDERRAAANRHAEARAFLETGFTPDLALSHQMTVEGPDWSLNALHTPGHAPDHLCFQLSNTGTLFSGDHVMGWNTTVIAPPEGRMSDYLVSLKLLLEGDPASATVFLAGHGEAIAEPQRMVRAYLMHRQMRESMIFDAVKDGLGKVGEITDRVYRGLAPGMLSAAKLSVLAHLEHLFERGLVSCDGPPSLHRTFRLA
jgi:glyoxylase-like metal-dependent hydrolase (beta-lactamase superfamily II)